MSIMKICHYGDPVLEKVAEEVDVVDDDIRLLLDDMLETMRAADGIGLAAPQVGISRRIVVVEVEGQQFKLINPVITKKSGKEKDTEGCLSVPDINGDVERAQFITLEYLDENGEKQVVEASGLLARCFQHELDHLDGVLFVTRLGRATKFLIKKRLNALKAATEAELSAE